MRWSKAGILYDADQRHSEIVVREMGFENAKAASTAGTREEQKAAGVPTAGLKVEVVETQRRFAEWPHAAITLPRTGLICSMPPRRPAGAWPDRVKLTGRC